MNLEIFGWSLVFWLSLKICNWTCFWLARKVPVQRVGFIPFFWCIWGCKRISLTFTSCLKWDLKYLVALLKRVRLDLGNLGRGWCINFGEIKWLEWKYWSVISWTEKSFHVVSIFTARYSGIEKYYNLREQIAHYIDRITQLLPQCCLILISSDLKKFVEIQFVLFWMEGYLQKKRFRENL